MEKLISNPTEAEAAKTEAATAEPAADVPETASGMSAENVAEDPRDAEISALKAEAERLKIALANAENRREAPPSPPKGGNGGFFSPDEVKKMSPFEVRENMTAIRQSMEKWK